MTVAADCTMATDAVSMPAAAASEPLTADDLDEHLNGLAIAMPSARAARAAHGAAGTGAGAAAHRRVSSDQSKTADAAADFVTPCGSPDAFTPTDHDAADVLPMAGSVVGSPADTKRTLCFSPGTPAAPTSAAHVTTSPFVLASAPSLHTLSAHSTSGALRGNHLTAPNTNAHAHAHAHPNGSSDSAVIASAASPSGLTIALKRMSVAQPQQPTTAQENMNPQLPLPLPVPVAATKGTGKALAVHTHRPSARTPLGELKQQQSAHGSAGPNAGSRARLGLAHAHANASAANTPSGRAAAALPAPALGDDLSHAQHRSLATPRLLASKKQSSDFESPVYSKLHIALNAGAALATAKAVAGLAVPAAVGTTEHPLAVALPGGGTTVAPVAAAAAVAASTSAVAAARPVPAHLSATAGDDHDDALPADLPQLTAALSAPSPLAGPSDAPPMRPDGVVMPALPPPSVSPNPRGSRRGHRTRTQSISASLLNSLQRSDDADQTLLAFAEAEAKRASPAAHALGAAAKAHSPAPLVLPEAGAATSAGEPSPSTGAGTDADLIAAPGSVSGVSPTNGGVLPALAGEKVYGIKRISPDTVAKLVRGGYAAHFDRYIIIDARYDYEYHGGHVATAVNVTSRQQLAKFYGDTAPGQEEAHESRVAAEERAAAAAVAAAIAAVKDATDTAAIDAAAANARAARPPVAPTRLAVVFHCEFSKNRGPKSAAFFRQLDRQCNEAKYPHLTFPELAVMDGGYKKFFEQHPDLCTPRAYVSMWDPAHSEECKQRTRDFRMLWAEDLNPPSGSAASAKAGGGAGTLTVALRSGSEDLADPSGLAHRRGSLGGGTLGLALGGGGGGGGRSRRSRTMRIREPHTSTGVAPVLAPVSCSGALSARELARERDSSASPPPPARKPNLVAAHSVPPVWSVPPNDGDVSPFDDSFNSNVHTAAAAAAAAAAATAADSQARSDANRQRLRGRIAKPSAAAAAATGASGASGSGAPLPPSHHERRATFNSSRFAELARSLPSDYLPSLTSGFVAAPLSQPGARSNRLPPLRDAPHETLASACASSASASTSTSTSATSAAGAAASAPATGLLASPEKTGAGSDVHFSVSVSPAPAVGAHHSTLSPISSANTSLAVASPEGSATGAGGAHNHLSPAPAAVGLALSFSPALNSPSTTALPSDTPSASPQQQGGAAATAATLSPLLPA